MLGYAGASTANQRGGDRLPRTWRRSAALGAVVVVLGPLTVWVAAAGAAPSRPSAQARAVVTSSVPGTLDAVTCTASSSCTAVGSYGSSGDTVTLAEAWNGSAWTVQPTPNPAGGSNSNLAGVSCGSPSACLAVGDYYDGRGNGVLAEMWNGTSWAIESVPLPSGGLGGALLGVSCTSATACTAVGDYADSSNTNVALAEVWNGTDFASETVPTPVDATTSALAAVSCSALPSRACEAVGFNYVEGGVVAMTLAERWNGTSWSAQNTPAPNDSSGGSYPSGVSCSAPKACTSVDEAFNGSGDLGYGWVQAWNGTTWSNRKTPNPKGATASTLSGVSCSTAPSRTCTAVGYYIKGSGLLSFAEGWNGTKWSVQRTPEPKGSTGGGLDGVSCSSPPGTCTAVGSVTNRSGVG